MSVALLLRLKFFPLHAYDKSLPLFSVKSFQPLVVATHRALIILKKRSVENFQKVCKFCLKY